MKRIAVLATGGTIASRPTGAGGATVADTSVDLLSRVTAPQGVQLLGRDVLGKNSFELTPRDMQTVLDAVLEALAGEVDGVVVTHGTDTLEETAFFVDLFLADERPVVFTGAQRGADAADTDGPANIRDAVTVAAAVGARGLGALVVFDGSIFAARGTRKTHTLASAAFSSPDIGPIGGLAQGRPSVWSSPRRQQPLDAASLRAADVRVDVVAIYPGCDSTALEAVVDAGAQGVVLEGTGAGNANSTITDTVAELTARGVVVLLSTRVSSGFVTPIYGGGGGGVDLVAAGAIPTGLLRPSQARMLLIAALGTGGDIRCVRELLGTT